ncbi:hypothetical protein [Mucilaginibacter sp. CSA2-8R]|uniref:hypothetical protein n=1 Tax=Mucilaginibacter sp. CSA2-8R TaxID=3141542 RepID=UPI00315C7EBB
MKPYFFLALSLFVKLTTFAQCEQLRPGQHAFTLQWIDLDKHGPGSVTIQALGNNKYSIEGEQRDKEKKDYVTIKGTIMADKETLYFDGKIVSKVGFVNNGKPCEVTGPAVFKAIGKRRYWRLQRMSNCDGISSDYIDIYF